MMWRTILMATGVLWGATCAEETPVNMEKRSAGSYAGSYAGGTAGASAGGAGGYTGNYNDYDDYGGYAPNYNYGAGFMDPYTFHQQLTAQILAQNAAHQNFILQQQAAMFDGLRRQNQYNNKDITYSKHNHHDPNYSAAAASIGPRGGFQTAYISPENPAVPNIVNRFADIGPEDGGFKGVSVSSFSSSSDINGKKSSQRGAQTTINDNGRITTYKVHS